MFRFIPKPRTAPLADDFRAIALIEETLAKANRR